MTIERNGFLLRMTAEEAALYGDEAIDLLTEARDLFSKKYNTQIEDPVIVEIFPEKKDFAVRTFGIPGGDGSPGPQYPQGLVHGDSLYVIMSVNKEDIWVEQIPLSSL